jgi:Pentapeptide repeats (8 copies)
MDSQDLVAQYQAGKRDFSQSHLANTILSDQILRNIDFTNTNLAGADLSGSDLRKAVLDHANLTGVNLQNANLRRSFLAGADLSCANLCGANLSQAVFEDSDHELLILQDAVYDELTQFPDGVDPRSLGALLAEEITIEANGELELRINSIDDSDSHASNQQDIEAPLPTPLSNKRDTKELPASPTVKPLLSSVAPSSANDPTRKSIFVLFLLPIIFIFGLGGFFALSYIYPVQE